MLQGSGLARVEEKTEIDDCRNSIVLAGTHTSPVCVPANYLKIASAYNSRLISLHMVVAQNSRAARIANHQLCRQYQMARCLFFIGNQIN